MPLKSAARKQYLFITRLSLERMMKWCSGFFQERLGFKIVIFLILKIAPNFLKEYQRGLITCNPPPVVEAQGPACLCYHMTECDATKLSWKETNGCPEPGLW